MLKLESGSPTDVAMGNGHLNVHRRSEARQSTATHDSVYPNTAEVQQLISEDQHDQAIFHHFAKIIELVEVIQDKFSCSLRSASAQYYAYVLSF